MIQTIETVRSIHLLVGKDGSKLTQTAQGKKGLFFSLVRDEATALCLMYEAPEIAASDTSNLQCFYMNRNIIG